MDQAPIMTHKGLGELAKHADHSWCERLNVDPDWNQFKPNKSSRQVRSGHYVPVKPTPLPKPYLVAYSRQMAQEFGLTHQDCTEDPRFLYFFAGWIESIESLTDGECAFKSWATPYALAIYGQDMYHNCPFKNGNGYGDGRAVSIGEVLLDNGKRWEMQLKGGGKTPFCRGGDGRAVLRSSVREFLASEAMFNLGVSTTRALSLVATKAEPIQRPWFSDNSSYEDPDVMVSNRAAITCRVAPSFLRVGHVQLFERRVRNNRDPNSQAFKLKELELIVEHVIFREYPECNEKFRKPDVPDHTILTEDSPVRDLKTFLASHQVDFEGCYEKSEIWEKVKKTSPNPKILTPALEVFGPIQPRILAMMEAASKKFAKLMADWQRVGYNQGNFNSDNCLVGGRTMDYGPFGFMEKFSQTWCMWTGGAPHFAYGNQPNAGIKNYMGLASAVRPLLDDEGAQALSVIVKKHAERTMNKVNSMWASKLGLPKFDADVHSLISQCITLMESTLVDFTIFWRQLAVIVESFLHTDISTLKDEQLLDPLKDCFYRCYPLVDTQTASWIAFMQQWFQVLEKQIPLETSGKEVADKMRKVSPKFVPREWMLIDAYKKAEADDLSTFNELYTLFINPYDEQTPELTEKYYRRAQNKTQGGRSFMT